MENSEPVQEEKGKVIPLDVVGLLENILANSDEHRARVFVAKTIIKAVIARFRNNEKKLERLKSEINELKELLSVTTYSGTSR